MLRQLLTILLITLICAGGFFWYEAATRCPIPIAYRIGTVDDRFDLSQEEIKAHLAAAETVWEESTGRDVFEYAHDARLSVNFVFDARQEFVNTEEQFSDRLDAVEAANEAKKLEYEKMVAAYDARKAVYDAELATVRVNQLAFNEEVDDWNANGGAPADVFEELQIREQNLNAQWRALEVEESVLRDEIDRLNALLDETNGQVEIFNESVVAYNETFTESREFTQGDYQGDQINVYHFADEHELISVLAHELGHALAIDHVDKPSSIMYYLMSEQPDQLVLSEEDLAAFVSRCGTE